LVQNAERTLKLTTKLSNIVHNEAFINQAEAAICSMQLGEKFHFWLLTTNNSAIRKIHRRAHSYLYTELAKFCIYSLMTNFK